jgi:hypothetical protein
MTVAPGAVKTVATPCVEYQRRVPLWKRSRALCAGEQTVKSLDAILDSFTFSNLLTPFSPTMSQSQYNWYRSEAELPGITAEFAKMVVGGLLRKPPVVALPESVPEDASEWILKEFGQDGCTLSAFMDEALWEEIQTSRAWVYVDYPQVEDEDLSRDERRQYRPYPVVWKAEKVINWRINKDMTGRLVLGMVVTRELVEDRASDEFHPRFVDTVRVHDVSGGAYRVRVYRKPESQAEENASGESGFVLQETVVPLMEGAPLPYIPAWPLNGSIATREPALMPIINKEVALYNKMSRRNHLLYGAATYTPVICADITDEKFDEIVESGLGTWLKLPPDGKASVLETPTAALQDMDRAIASSIEEIAKLGVRMLTPETDQSGVALHLRNAAQTAQLGSLNERVGAVMSQVISLMLTWRYGTEFPAAEVSCTLSEDFNQTPLGADWLRLATEWYDSGKIPRSVWLQLLKQNDMLPSEYDDKQGMQEIQADMDILLEKRAREMDYAAELSAETKPPAR